MGLGDPDIVVTPPYEIPGDKFQAPTDGWYDFRGYWTGSNTSLQVLIRRAPGRESNGLVVDRMDSLLTLWPLAFAGAAAGRGEVFGVHNGYYCCADSNTVHGEGRARCRLTLWLAHGDIVTFSSQTWEADYIGEQLYHLRAEVSVPGAWGH